jgi:adenylosuccinate lyase
MSKFLPSEPKAFAFLDGLDPLDNRYFDTEVSRFLSLRARIAYQAYVEAMLTETYADYGLAPKEVAAEVAKAAKSVTAEQVTEEENTTKHDVKALVNVMASKVSGQAKPFIHKAATSYDIVSTAQSTQYKDVTNLVIVPRLVKLEQTLIKKALLYAENVQIGRTHGQHALPITFGFALSEYVSRLGQSIVALKALANELTGKFSGAVGAYNGQSLFIEDVFKFEKSFLAKIGLTPAEYSNQIVPPEPSLRLIDELVITAGIMANLATDMRHLQRSEIAEIKEQFDKKQIGSSTMAHKRNPISFENVVSLYKQTLAQLLNANLNSVSEHQRDLTDSASSRFYPIIFASIAEMAKRLNDAIGKIEIDKEAMERNLNSSQGAIAAEPLYLLLAKYGVENAHEKAKVIAHQAIDNQLSFVDAIKKSELGIYWDKMTRSEQQIIANPETNYVGLSTEKTLAICQNWQKQITNLH